MPYCYCYAQMPKRRPSCRGGRAPVELTTEVWSVCESFRSANPFNIFKPPLGPCRCARKDSSALNFLRSLEP